MATLNFTLEILLKPLCELLPNLVQRLKLELV